MKGLPYVAGPHTLLYIRPDYDYVCRDGYVFAVFF